MTTELDELHHDVAMPAMEEHVSEWAELNHAARAGAGQLAGTTTSRRGFLLGTGGAALGAVVLAACSKGSSKSTSASSASTAAGGQLTGDVQIAAMAASLENLAVGTYQAALQAAQAGKLGTVPPAVATFAQTAMSQ
ncbi:MAG: ferritin-like domain-containing protein, partial [Acidimicrobiia bacterium]|nr:ferritin-like domain-containing protein [Acidimicrobiia bacterium]